MTDAEKIDRLRAALAVILDHIDYTKQACAPTEMVGAVLPDVLISAARATLRDTEDS